VNPEVMAVVAGESSFGDDALRYFGLLLIIFTVAAILTALFWIVLRILRLPSYSELIGEWCLSHQLRLVDLERRFLRAGPFLLSPNGTAVFYVTVSDPLGNQKHLWVRCGHWLFGMLIPELCIREAD
jgi:hypothetical protein